MTERHTERWYRIRDSAGVIAHVRGNSYEDAAQQLVHRRRMEEGRYNECPDYDQFLLLIGGPLNPLRVEEFELYQKTNGMTLDQFSVVLDDDALALEQAQAREQMARNERRNPSWMSSGRHG